MATYHTYFEEYLYHYLPILPKGGLRYLARSMSRRQCNDLDGLVVPSSGMLEVLRGYGISAHAEIIPTGLPAESFLPGDGHAFRARHGIAHHRPVMLYVGRVAFEKNIGFLLDVTDRVRRELPDALLLVAGEGPALRWLEREAERRGLGGNVLFVGYLDRRQELPDCYRAANLFVFSSRTETQGLVLLEAMAQGVPVVALSEMGTRDILREGHGAMIARHDAGDFAAKALLLLRHPASLAAHVGRLGKAHVALWNAGALADRMLDFYRGVIERRDEVATRAQTRAGAAA